MTTVLLADDHDTLRRMLARVLERRGCRVLIACDGLEAVTQFQAHADETDVVILDVRMPHLEGPEALTRIRALSPEMPAILMSGFADANAAIRGLIEGGVRFVPKPVRASALADLVFELAASRAAGATNE